MNRPQLITRVCGVDDEAIVGMIRDDDASAALYARDVMRLPRKLDALKDVDRSDSEDEDRAGPVIGDPAEATVRGEV